MSEPTVGSRIRILVAEDEENLAQILCTFLRGRGHYVVCVGDGKSALQAVRDEAFDVALVDIVMPEMDGLETLKHLRAEPDPPQVIIITGNGTVETAINAMKLGAYDYMAKPYRMAEIDVLVRRAWEKHQLARENRYLQARLSRVDATPEVITQYAPMHAVLALLSRVATTDSPVLITGESGTGKTLLARAIHRLSGRVGPMVEADSTVVAEGVLDVELFGHERGAFTGAVQRKAGLIELAANGTLFIDEVGLLSSKLQSKLTRALEHGSFFRIGGTQKVDISVRLVTSSNHDLEAAVRDGRFRDDLLYRLNVVTVALPPLRDRVIDIPLLAQHFLTQFAGASTPVLTADAIALMRSIRGPATFASSETSSSESFCWRAAATARFAPRICRCSRPRRCRVRPSVRRPRSPSWNDSTSTPCCRRRIGIRAMRQRSSASRRRRSIARSASMASSDRRAAVTTRTAGCRAA